MPQIRISNNRDYLILLGNTLDHFDTALYSFLVPVLSPLFFPKHDIVVSLILGYGVLATSFFAAPLGAFIFSAVAKSRGAAFSLSYSLIGLSVATILIGLLPTYNQIGISSSIILILTRMLQSIFAAGESTIAKLYIIEGKSKQDAFKASYSYQFSSMLGIILASFITTIIYSLPEASIWWRICFLLGGITGAAGYLLRKLEIRNNQSHFMLSDSKKSFIPSFTTLLNGSITTLKSLLRNRKTIIAIAFTSAFGHITYSVPFILMNSFVPLITSINLQTMMQFNTILLLFDTFLIPVLGKLLNRSDSQKIMIAACMMLAVTIIPLIYYLSNAPLWYVIAVRIWMIILGVTFLCPLNLWYKNISFISDRLKIPSINQYLLVGIANSIGAGAIGKMTPTICLGLWYATNSLLPVGIYIVLIALITAYIIKDSNIVESKTLPGHTPPK